ncbi:MAG: right-handed parallel beta-helix repeat-containing protein, partial [Actinobacteria bacterium]|nr:right-handed parallel beta-helix repeat-containing protein [Actinomycetota bacterium]NIU71324.1 right-handed parallel beta-helix repeat-containing protein [Actinomycetota bacterium]NIW33276.1 hypothetical protein [Actinomycetota bacterium]
FTGTDQFIYVIGDDTATVALTVEDRVWFIDNNAAACTSVASGCGRLSSPFSSLAAFGTANTGTGNDPGDGDVVFLHESTSAYTGPLTLRAGQVLVGQDAAASLAAIAGLTPGASSEPFPAMTPADGTHATITGGSGGIVLGTNNTLRGLTVATTGGTAISGSAFGTLTLAGDVDVDASGGPALSLSNGAFSGAFRSVAADGGANGIVLSSTTGTFTVAGTGTAGTGGTIQNATDAGVSLTNTGPVELAWMTIQTNGGDGITGSTVAGFTLRQSTVSGNGDAIGDHGLHFTELTGTVRIDTTTVSGSGDDGVLVDNSSGTIDLTVIGSAFTDNATRHLAFEAAGSAGGAVTVADNDFSGGGSGILVIGEEEPADWSGAITYDIHDNRLSASGGVSILAELRESTSSATMTGHIRDNALGTTTVACNTGGPGIQVAGEGGGTHTVAVTGNTLRGCQQDAISAYAAAGSATLNLTVQSNGVTDVSFFGGFLLLMG